MNTNDEDITEGQLLEVDRLVSAIHASKDPNGRPDFLGDDENMIRAVSEAARASRDGDESYAEKIVHVC